MDCTSTIAQAKPAKKSNSALNIMKKLSLVTLEDLKTAAPLKVTFV